MKPFPPLPLSVNVTAPTRTGARPLTLRPGTGVQEDGRGRARAGVVAPRGGAVRAVAALVVRVHEVEDAVPRAAGPVHGERTARLHAIVPEGRIAREHGHRRVVR